MRNRSVSLALTAVLGFTALVSTTSFVGQANATTMGVTPLPPDPSTTYWMQCRGGMAYEVKAIDNSGQGGGTASTVVLQLMDATKAPGKASKSMPAGSCAWHNRALNEGEKTDITIIAYTEEQKSVLTDIRSCLRDTGCLVSFKAKSFASPGSLQGHLTEAVQIKRGS